MKLDELNMSNMLEKQEKLLVNKMRDEEILGAATGGHHVLPCVSLSSRQRSEK